jgi:integrase
MKLTQKGILRLEMPAGKTDHLVWDDVPGFGARIPAGGTKVWICQYRTDGGKQRRETIGKVEVLDADKAREAAKKILAKVTLGEDPQAKKQEAKARARHTFGSLKARYLESKRASLKAGTFSGLKTYMTAHWAPLDGKPVHKITRQEVAEVLSEIKIKRPVAAARARSWLMDFFVWAMGEGLVEQNPVIGTNKPSETPRDRALDDGEIAEVWAQCGGDDYGRIVKLLLLTGQRREEIGGVTDAEVDREGAAINLPGKRTKNGRPHRIPLAPMALDLIPDPRPGRPHLFGDNHSGRGFRGWSTAKELLDRRISEARAAAGKPAMPHWTPHDARRTFATGCANLGIQPHVIEAALNHVSGHKAGVAGVYNKSVYEREVRAAMALWADHVRTLAEGGERKVVAFERRVDNRTGAG